MLLQGQCIIGCMPFKDGTASNYRRPYLVVDVDHNNETVHVLNISSVIGKEHKLAFNSNVLLSHSIPPLLQQSFVKVDSHQSLSFEAAKEFKLAANGAPIHNDDLTAVLAAYQRIN